MCTENLLAKLTQHPICPQHVCTGNPRKLGISQNAALEALEPLDLAACVHLQPRNIRLSSMCALDAQQNLGFSASMHALRSDLHAQE